MAGAVGGEKGGLPMEPRQVHAQQAHGVSRRALLKAGLAAGATLSTLPLRSPPVLWGAEPGPPKRRGILRVRGWDPPHCDPHITGTFIVEPDLAERWESPDDTTSIFHLRKGVKWHNKPPVNGRELVAEDVKFSFDRFL